MWVVGCCHKQNYQANGGGGFRDIHVLASDDDQCCPDCVSHLKDELVNDDFDQNNDGVCSDIEYILICI